MRLRGDEQRAKVSRLGGTFPNRQMQFTARSALVGTLGSPVGGRHGAADRNLKSKQTCATAEPRE